MVARVPSHLKAEKNASVIARVPISHPKKQIQSKDQMSFLLIVFIFLYHINRNGLNTSVPKKCSKNTMFIAGKL